ncbi:MAG: hypothetical protein RSD22_03720 [Romboutsia sp.]
MNKNNWNNVFPDAPDSFKNRVRSTLDNLPDKKGYGEMEDKKVYKKVSFKKKMVVALAVTFVLGTTAFAAGKLTSITSHSSNLGGYKSMPTVEHVTKKFGFTPVLVEEFDNGYKFKSGYSSDMEGLDESGNVLGKSKSLSIEYANNKNKDSVHLNMENLTLVARDEKEVVVDNYKDIELSYLAYANKLVPGDYEMTEQDKEDEKSGKYVFSYGSRDIEVSNFQHLSFIMDDIYYSFMTIDSDMSQEELVKMAKEIIDNK